MDYVATLIVPRGQVAVLDPAAAGLARAIGAGTPSILAPGEAADLFFASAEPVESLRTRIQAEVASAPIDVVVQSAAHRKKKLLVADMDSTIIGQECIDELADFAGLKDKVAAITERAMRGEIEFEPALRERVALLEGLPVATIARVIEERIRLTPGAKALIWTMRANGARTILVSGGFTAFTDTIARRVGFDESHANRLEVDGDRLAGTVAEPILGRAAKLATLEEAIIRFNLAVEDTLAVGDGANDLAMIHRAGLGVAFHAKPKVAEAAAARINHGDLTALLYLQGYKKTEFA